MIDPRSGHSPRVRPLRRLVSAAVAVLGLAPGAALAETPQAVAPRAAPQAWLDYARLVSDQVQLRLTGDDPAAVRLRDYLNQLPGADGPQGVTLRMAFWVDDKGMIARIDFPLFAPAEPNDDLKVLMVGLHLPKAPPKGMLLPLRLAIQVKPKDEPKPQAWAAPWPKPSVKVQVSYEGLNAIKSERG